MKIQELYEQIKIEYEWSLASPILSTGEKGRCRHISKKKSIMLGYAVDMLDTICKGEMNYGKNAVNKNSDAKELTYNVLLNHCRGEEDFCGRLLELCRTASFGGNFECYNYNLAYRLRLKPERWAERGPELLERQASFIAWAVKYIERKAGIIRKGGRKV